MTRMPFRGGAPGAGGEVAGGGPLQRARIALMNNQPAVTEDICRRRLEKRPDETSTRLLLAQALIQMRRGREAVGEARRVLQDQPKNVDAMLLLSSALMGTNQFSPPKEALELAERAVELQPKAARTHVQLAEVLMVRREFDRARDQAEEAVKLEPRLAAASLMKGMALMNLKDYQSAVQSFQSALRNDKTLTAAHFSMAQALSELNRPDEALEALNRAQTANSNIPPQQMTQLRAQIFRKQRKYRASYNEYVQLVMRDGRRGRFTNVTAAYMFAMSFFGRYAPAVLIGIIVLILFGISRIPAAGGWLVDAVVVGLIGVGGWLLVRQYTGVTPPARLSQGRVGLITVGGFALSLLVIFGLARLIGGFSTAAHQAVMWFNPVSLGLGLGIGLAVAYGVMALLPDN